MVNKEDILREIQAIDDYKPLSDKIGLQITPVSDNTTRVEVTLKMGVQILIPDLQCMNPADHFEYYMMHVKDLLNCIEKNLWKLIPSLKLPVDVHDGTHIRINNHIPKGVILMHPETYMKCQEFDLLQRLRFVEIAV